MGRGKLLCLFGVILVKACGTGSIQTNRLIEHLEVSGVTASTTARIEVVGSEADFGPDVVAVISDETTISRAWQSIAESKPTGLWYASGYRQLRFYSMLDGESPKAVLMLNESDAVHIQGDSPLRRQMCVGLSELAIELLEKVFEGR